MNVTMSAFFNKGSVNPKMAYLLTEYSAHFAYRQHRLLHSTENLVCQTESLDLVWRLAGKTPVWSKYWSI